MTAGAASTAQERFSGVWQYLTIWPPQQRRTAAFEGRRQAEQLAKYRRQWDELEGREPQRQQERAKAQKVERDNCPE
jgi:ABC-type cobalamin transport system ATPase subunit